MATLAGAGAGGVAGGIVGALVRMGIPEFEAKLWPSHLDATQESNDAESICPRGPGAGPLPALGRNVRQDEGVAALCAAADSKILIQTQYQRPLPYQPPPPSSRTSTTIMRIVSVLISRSFAAVGFSV